MFATNPQAGWQRSHFFQALVAILGLASGSEEFQCRHCGLEVAAHYSKALATNHFHVKIGKYWPSEVKKDTKPFMFFIGGVCVLHFPSCTAPLTSQPLNNLLTDT